MSPRAVNDSLTARWAHARRLTLSLSPAVLGGHQKDLSGLIADEDAEKRSVLLNGGKKKLPLYQNRQHLAQITQ